MMDAKLMATLLSSIQTGSRLILMGDRYQLPAVEAGSLFADLIDLQTVMSIPCTSLQTSLRTDSQSILDLAKAINQGHTDQALAFFNRPEYPHLVYTDIPTTKKEFLTLLAQRLEPYYLSTNQNHLVEEILVNFNQCKILSPMRKGPFGIDAINQFLYHHFSHLHQKWLTIPILITANDYRRELFNGETGLLIRHFKQGQLPDSLQPEDYALFATRDGTHSRRLPAFLLPPYEYAYCLSVHKSQGSEFKHVILIMPEGAEVFGREVLYTAVTRARQSIEIFSYPHILHETMAHVANRFSGIQHRLNCRHI
jgi:exodeoxyribonuclease V alpha subunit